MKKKRVLWNAKIAKEGTMHESQTQDKNDESATKAKKFSKEMGTKTTMADDLFV